MKTIKKISILFLSLITFLACNDDNLNVDNPDGNAVEGGLLDVKNTSINYVVGNPGPYSASIRVYQGAVKSTSIRVAKTFYSGDFVSNTVDTFKTIAISDTNQNSFVNYDFSFPEMVEGLTGANGSPLSATDTDYQIGDYWKFDYYVTNSNGEHLNYASTKATISTRFAGTYRVVESAYWNSGGFNGDWNGDQFVIESIDANIYKHNGLAFWSDNTYYFTVDSGTGAITILGKDLDDADVLLNTSPIMTCEGDYTFESLTCINQATANDVTGEDVLEFTTGYFRGVGATREFYEKMVKIVD
ncbi:hypothetical protein [Lutibacter flavus]|uniref:DUF4465 domain-containing protein n=1 Tax=Lutibacter flavus TaxID=691689 RepID=A0A238Y0W7_9FLAO|nr:hypothetical protein [Lutibacter flavus]SNR64458.1 hypothetical protein SAMN04488111_2253 [Lutibacter flavus]